MKTIDPRLISKYNTPVPRYTSYPTVPYWDEQIEPTRWERLFRLSCSEQDALALYIHLPFCESLCTYCGCNKKITTNHQVEEKYLKAVIAEWRLYRAMMPAAPVIAELHIGGGTPTFFSPQHLEQLLNAVLKDSIVAAGAVFSIEGHPNNTTSEHLATLASMGFKRVSFGVQDNDPQVQQVINRLQPFENVQRVTEQARAAGFTSINYDLIYGLPLQTIAGMRRTIHQVLQLVPDRIAFYSYAHVPWTSRGQRLFNESHLPNAVAKQQLYATGQQLFQWHGYHDVGMDHFALPHDELLKAKTTGTLHRNFMGYTTQSTGVLLGLGMSAISDVGYAYAQNDKTMHNYYTAIFESRPAVKRGLVVSEEDRQFRNYILDISCRSATRFLPQHEALLKEQVFPRLDEMAADGLLTYDHQGLSLTDEGQFFLRQVCSAFDLKMRSQVPAQRPAFSKGV